MYLNVIKYFSIFSSFGPDLLSIAIPILQFIQQALVWTDKALSKQQTLNDLKLVINVRIAAYKSLSTWLKHCGSASAIEWMADKFLPFILKDIIPERKTVVLSVSIFKMLNFISI